MSQPLVSVDVTGGVATITLDSSTNRNALSRGLLADLHHALDAVEHSDARVIVLTHAGPAFCSGADLKERANTSASESGGLDAASHAMTGALRRLMTSTRPTIASVNGAVRAGGIGLMASCDLVAVAPEVTFAFTEVRIGVAPAIISVPILRRVSPAHLTAPFLTGETFDARHAAAIGLVDAVGEPDAVVANWCNGILAAAPGAVAATKVLLHTVPGQPVDVAFDQMSALSTRLFAGAEAHEGMAAFVERRAPNWTRGVT